MTSVSYRVETPNLRSHVLEITVDIRSHEGRTADLVMPAWTPGSYRIRDYARNVQDFSAGRFSWKKIDKNRWRVETGGAPRVTVKYRVYAFELNARGAHLDDRHLYFNGAAVFMYLDGHKDEAAAAVPRELLELSNLCGPAGFVRDRLAAYAEAGVTMLHVTPVGPDPVGTMAQLKAWTA